MQFRFLGTAVAASLALTACATDGAEPTPTATVTVTAPAPSAHDHGDGTHEHPDQLFTYESEEKRFLKRLEKRLEELDPAEQRGLIAVGYVACESLDHGDSVESVVTDATEPMGTDLAPLLVQAAAADLCPAHSEATAELT